MLRKRFFLLIISIATVGALLLFSKLWWKEYRKSEDSTPTRVVLDSTKGVFYAKLRQSIQSLNTLYIKFPKTGKSATFADSLADLYKKIGQFDSAAWFAEKAASFFASRESFRKAGNYFYDAYGVASAPGKRDEFGKKTRVFLEKVLDNEPKNTDIIIKIATTYFDSPTPMRGIVMLREVVEQEPNNEKALFNLGMLCIQSAQYKKASFWFKKVIHANPNHLQAQLLLGVAHLHAGQREEAEAQFKKVKKMDSDAAVQATVDSYLEDLK